jgi:glycosyltransferase involved in cell wall biosynthesis
LAYIKDGHSGLLTEPGDSADLARALQAVMLDREWAAELGRNAQERIWAEFDWQDRVGEVERAYQIARDQWGKES